MTIPIIDDLERARRGILRRVAFDEVRVPPAVLARIEATFGAPLTPAAAVERILAEVRHEGDAALQRWNARLDGYHGPLEVPAERMAAALAALDPALRRALETAAGEIERFHRRQARTSWIEFDTDGALGQIVRPLQRVGIYVPGGAAPLPSSLLMAAIPARVAGVPEIVMCSPPRDASGGIDPVVLAAAAIAGVTRVFAIGGAQAIGALAYGSASVPQVDKIVGPGNLFVVLAKRAVYGVVGIEALPGPTETLVIADEQADPRHCAADLLAQAEHVLASAIMLTPSRALAEATQREIARQLEALPDAHDAAETVAARGAIVVVPDLASAFELANAYAPEHLCLLLADAWEHVGRVHNAGGIFVGTRSFEVLGDYVAGPSHIMPTGGTARFASPVNVDDFRKVISLVALNDAALTRLGPVAIAIAEAEGLHAHAAAVRARLDEGGVV
jgi:histidinol dehydrogenase